LCEQAKTNKLIAVFVFLYFGLGFSGKKKSDQKAWPATSFIITALQNWLQ